MIEENMVSTDEIVDENTYVDEDGVTQDVIEQYNPNVELDEEEVVLDTTLNDTFKIDENMPPELKAQLEKFNRHSESLNSIISGAYDVSINTADSSDYTDTTEDEDEFDDTTEEESDGGFIEENDIEVGNLF